MSENEQNKEELVETKVEVEIPESIARQYILGIEKDTGIIRHIGYAQALKPKPAIMIASTKPPEIEWTVVKEVSEEEKWKVLPKDFNPAINGIVTGVK